MYLVFDAETTMRGGFGRDSNPFIDKILCTGYKYQKPKLLGYNAIDALLGNYQPTDLFSTKQDYPLPGFLNDVDTLIGHNIKFDLLFIWRSHELQNYLKRGGRIWDTQLAEYLLSGQRHKYPALRDIAVNRYGCRERVKHLEGKNTEEVPIELLLEDVRNDVLDTEAVALQQAKLTKEKQMHALCKTQMEGLLATTEMEFNGMYIDKQKLLENKAVLQNEYDNALRELMLLVNKHWNPATPFNSGSPKQVSQLFFGGIIKYKAREPILNALGVPEVIKSGVNRGTVKTKLMDKTIDYKGLGLKPNLSWENNNGYRTDEEVLDLIAKRPNTDAGKIAIQMLKIRELSKQLNTYYTGFEKLIYDWDGCIHGHISHCGYEGNDKKGGGTATGRTSSVNPNLQNIPRAKGSLIKEHFTSRFEGGVIIEADFKQLEVVAFAFLTQDPGLIADIVNGVDIHKRNASIIYSIPESEVTADQRQLVKMATFAIIYGAGANRIANDMNISKEFAKSIINTFFKRYPIAKRWQDNLIKKVESTKYIINEYTKKGHRRHEGYYQNVTGRLLYFKTNDSPDWKAEQGELTGFNPPDIKDYPVQSFATADIVLMFLGALFRQFIDFRSEFLLVNTVHDSIVIDCKQESVQKCCNIIKSVVQLIYDEVENNFGIKFNVPIGIDIKVGKTWRECGL